MIINNYWNQLFAIHTTRTTWPVTTLGTNKKCRHFTRTFAVFHVWNFLKVKSFNFFKKVLNFFKNFHFNFQEVLTFIECSHIAVLILHCWITVDSLLNAHGSFTSWISHSNCEADESWIMIRLLVVSYSPSQSVTLWQCDRPVTQTCLTYS